MMATSENTDTLAAEDFARKILDEMSKNPLLIEIKNKIQKHRELGLSDEKIETIIINSFKVTNAGYKPPEMEKKEIIVSNMPDKYNKLDWR